MQCINHREISTLGFVNQRSRQMVQMPDMDDIWPDLIKHLCEPLVDNGQPVSIAMAGIIDQVDSNTLLVLIYVLPERSVGPERVFFTSKNMNLMPPLGKRMTDRL
ncbi:hypothetical protein MSNKSG1_05753 [Marinobacter santoriniensis NKSG1]|uniref:Uncharacterized protein n=1 Tax=Marinobacter santoriniensis NKSG1 TaxID=1288826 RepID=M7DFK1_9GAMM|nr:hypothetical protein MSNKSG1_05753 [Marinobacter santoriniensis NKSG1]